MLLFGRKRLHSTINARKLDRIFLLFSFTNITRHKWSCENLFDNQREVYSAQFANIHKTIHRFEPTQHHGLIDDLPLYVWNVAKLHTYSSYFCLNFLSEFCYRRLLKMPIDDRIIQTDKYTENEESFLLLETIRSKKIQNVYLQKFRQTSLKRTWITAFFDQIHCTRLFDKQIKKLPESTKT